MKTRGAFPCLLFALPLGVAAALGLALASVGGGPVDTDLDGVPDFQDNCLIVANGPLAATFSCDSQEDGDHDGYGNPCDFDPNNDGGEGLDDVAATLQASAVVSTDPNLDHDCDGAVGLHDVGLMLLESATPDKPGPSGLACAGTIPCP